MPYNINRGCKNVLSLNVSSYVHTMEDKIEYSLN